MPRTTDGDQHCVWLELDSQREAYERLEEHVELGQHCLVTGPGGVGKTELARAVARKLRRPVEVFHFGGVLDGESMLYGAMTLGPTGTRFVRSRFAEAIGMPGVVLVLDELNRAPTSVHNALLGLLDGSRRLVLELEEPERRIVELAPGAVVIATANVGSEFVGTEVIDVALRDRFCMLRLDYPAEEEALLVEIAGVTPRQASELTRAARAIRAAHAHAGLPFTLSTRRLLEAGRLVARGHSVPNAIERNVCAFDDEALTALRATLRAARGKAA